MGLSKDNKFLNLSVSLTVVGLCPIFLEKINIGIYIQKIKKINCILVVEGIMRLTRREEQVMSLLTGGLKSTQIAECMGVSVRTVHAHLANIYSKFGVTNRAGALMQFLKSRLTVEFEVEQELYEQRK